MSGITVIMHLLAHAAAVTAAVPAASIQIGRLQLNTALPAISVNEIDSNPHNFINVNSANKMHTDRVQVSVICKWPQTAAQYTGLQGIKAILKLVLAACPSQRGTVNGVLLDSIVPDTELIQDEDTVDGIQEGSRDFFVRWTAS